MSIKTGKTESDQFIESIFILIFNIIKGIFTGLFGGIKKLGKMNALIPFLLLSLISVATYSFRHILPGLPYPETPKKAAFIALLALPVIYLIIIGSLGRNKASDYDKIFASIAFKGRDGKYPFFCNMKSEGKKQTCIFKSYIPLAIWLKNKDLLETAFDRNILNLKQGKSKNLIIMTTVPTECVIPEYISWKDEYLSPKEGVICIGVGALSKITIDLNKEPHSLIAGAPGSGKSVLLRVCFWQMIVASARAIMIDFKGGVEFGRQYERYGEVITRRERALEALDCLVAENDARLTLFRQMDVKNLPEYNRIATKKLCRIGLFCDEIAEMLDKNGASKADKVILDQLGGRLSTLARLARATGINLFLGTQRPDANVINGQIKNSVCNRVSGRFADKYAYDIALGTSAPFVLPDIKGRLIFTQGSELFEFQSYFFEDHMIRDIDIVPGEVLTAKIMDFFPSPNKSRSNTAPAPKEQAATSGNPHYDKWSADIDKLDDCSLNLDYAEEAL
jgi:S-DNA-T family DNA segregation ATPase FtsK/SpoIIIE